MSSSQVYLYQEQKDFLLKYMRDRRYKNMIIMWTSAVIILGYMGLFLLSWHKMTFIEAVAQEGIVEGFLYFIIAVFAFGGEFIRGFGKTFGYKCDIRCIQNDLYTLEYGDFGYREKDTGKHPYYICDNRGGIYICPRFLDYRNADTGSKFLYIKLENGRGYAVLDEQQD